MTKEELIKIFKNLGADEPESWADSQIKEGIPQLCRFLFLKGMWDSVVPDNEKWVDEYVNDTMENECFSGASIAIRKMIECGVPKKYITELCRGIGGELIFNIATMIDDPSVLLENDVVSWGLFELDGNGNPKSLIAGLHESVLETDPTGRECLPRENI
ncbi:MAG: hypothetical protein ACRBCS_05885 [Cellvibrionaceae bacterium]